MPEEEVIGIDPHSDGPNNTINSPGFISILNLSKAVVPPYFL